MGDDGSAGLGYKGNHAEVLIVAYDDKRLENDRDGDGGSRNQLMCGCWFCFFDTPLKSYYHLER